MISMHYIQIFQKGNTIFRPFFNNYENIKLYY
jgi:hypothetical protein